MADIYHSEWVYQNATIDPIVEHSAREKLDFKNKIRIPRKLFHDKLGRNKNGKITSKAKDLEGGGEEKNAHQKDCCLSHTSLYFTDSILRKVWKFIQLLFFPLG